MNTCMEIVGINASDCDHSCNEHQVCDVIVKEGTVLSLALVSLVFDGEEQPAIEAVEVKGGCQVGFGRRHLIKHAGAYNGAICRGTEVLSKDSTSPLKQQLNNKNKCCAFALINSFDGNDEEAGDDSDTHDTNND